VDIGRLRKLGLERYEPAFRENEIDETVLQSLTAEDLKDLGVGIVGHRRKPPSPPCALTRTRNRRHPTLFDRSHRSSDLSPSGRRVTPLYGAPIALTI
jgi:SAM domain (Sterile alpha motif)